MEVSPTDEEKQAAEAWLDCHYPNHSQLDLTRQQKLLTARVLQLRAEHNLLIRRLLEQVAIARSARELRETNQRDRGLDVKGKRIKPPRGRSRE